MSSQLSGGRFGTVLFILGSYFTHGEITTTSPESDHLQITTGTTGKSQEDGISQHDTLPSEMGTTIRENINTFTSDFGTVVEDHFLTSWSDDQATTNQTESTFSTSTRDSLTTQITTEEALTVKQSSYDVNEKPTTQSEHDLLTTDSDEPTGSVQSLQIDNDSTKIPVLNHTVWQKLVTTLISEKDVGTRGPQGRSLDNDISAPVGTTEHVTNDQSNCSSAFSEDYNETMQLSCGSLKDLLEAARLDFNNTVHKTFELYCQYEYVRMVLCSHTEDCYQKALPLVTEYRNTSSNSAALFVARQAAQHLKTTIQSPIQGLNVLEAKDRGKFDIITRHVKDIDDYLISLESLNNEALGGHRPATYCTIKWPKIASKREMYREGVKALALLKGLALDVISRYVTAQQRCQG